jgi:hypothetical protein
MNTLESLAREAWRVWAVYRKFTTCGGCGEMRCCGAARPRGPWLCLECHDMEGT